MKKTPDPSPPFASTKNVGMSNEEPEKMVNDRIVVKAIEPKDEEAWNKLWKEYQGFQKTVMPHLRKVYRPYGQTMGCSSL